jgi:hypothetical protein
MPRSSRPRDQHEPAAKALGLAEAARQRRKESGKVFDLNPPFEIEHAELDRLLPFPRNRERVIPRRIASLNGKARLSALVFQPIPARFARDLVAALRLRLAGG